MNFIIQGNGTMALDSQPMFSLNLKRMKTHDQLYSTTNLVKLEITISADVSSVVTDEVQVRF